MRPFLQGTPLKDTAALLASLCSYSEPSWSWMSSLTWSKADEMLCQPGEAALRLLTQVLLHWWRPNGASSTFPGGLHILGSRPFPVLSVHPAVWALGLMGIAHCKASILIVLEKERLV